MLAEILPETIAKLLTAMTAVVGAILALLQFIRSRRDKVAAVRQSFDAVVKSLASTVEVERISGAILLRRFYDAKSDVGIGLRMGLPRTPKNLLRIDLAYALNRDPLGRKGWLVAFSSGQAF